MKTYNENRNKKIYEIVAMIKLLSLMVCGIGFFSSNNILMKTDIKALSGFNIITMIITLATMLFIYKAWFFLLDDKNIYTTFSLRNIIEYTFFIIFFSILILLSGGFASQYKFIYMFIIISGVIELGSTYGLTIAGVSSVIVLGIDYFTFPYDGINKYLESDMVLAGVFILIAWLIGYYVNIEDNYRKQLINLANKDELTGVYNHRYFQEALEEHIRKSKCLNNPLSLLFIDIDHFKSYNDLYGHLLGDVVLEEVGKLLLENNRKQDVVTRYGGEEFAIIMGNTHEEEAIITGEKIRKIIQNKYFEGEENLPNNNLTVSIGISTFPTKAKTKRDLINSADDALYRAKFLSKNRVESYYSILEELKDDIEEEHIDLISSIKTLISVINAKDRYTYGHTMRVVMYCQMLGAELDLSVEDQKLLKFGAYLHDIGKIEIPREILNKKMSLTQEEWDCIKDHPKNGVGIIRAVPSLENLIPLILNHHERYDGEGYPEKLRGEDIPFLARVLTVADSFDAMTSNRPYNKSKSLEDAKLELERCKGSQFDPNIVEVFITIIDKHPNNFIYSTI